MNLFQLILIFFIAFDVIVFAEPQKELVELDCDTANDCIQFVAIGTNVTCENGTCVCDRSSDGTRIDCKVNPINGKVSNTIPGKCPCVQENSECDTKLNICLCQKNYETSFDNRRCILKEVPLGKPCEHHGQCLASDKYSFCQFDDKVCQCEPKFAQYEGICLGAVVLKGNCLNDSQCLLLTPNSKCLDNKCLCDENYVPSSIHNKCLPSAGYNDQCQETYQCRSKLGVGSECYSGACTCDSRHKLISNNDVYYCERRVMIGDTCRDHNECYQYHMESGKQAMECFDYKCKCRNNFKIIDNICAPSSSTTILLNITLFMLVPLILLI